MKNNKLKRICAGVVLGVSATSMVGVATINLNNNQAVYGIESHTVAPTITVSAVPKKVELGTSCNIPVATMNGGNLTETKVFYNEKEITISSGSIDVEYVGTYVIQYTFTKDAKTYVAKVNFESVKTVGTLSDVSSALPLKLPTTLPTGVSIKMPIPEVKDADGEVMAGVVVTPTITAPNYQTLSVNAEGYIDFTNATENGKLKTGNYSIKFVATKSGVNIGESKTYTFEVVEGYNVTNLKYDYNTSLTSVELGKTVDLPEVKGVDYKTKLETENVNVAWTVKKVTLTTEDGTVSNELTMVSGKEFTPTKKGTYVIEYEVKDYLGNVSTYEKNLEVVVKDTIKPEIKVVEPYATDATTHTEALHKLVSKADPDAEIVVMPMWAEDFGAPNFADLTMKIEVQNRTNLEYVFKSDDFNDATAPVNKKLIFNKTAAYTINETTEFDTGINLVKGNTYRVYYTAKDKDNAEVVKTYDIQVVDGFAYDVAPTVEWTTTFPKTIHSGEEVTFTAPTFSDANDERLDTKVEYSYGATDTWTALELNDDDKYSLVVNTDLATVKFRATATNSGGRTTDKTETIDIVDMSDANLPVIATLGTFADGYTQGDEVVIPAVHVTDDKIAEVKINVNVEHIDGDTVTPMAITSGAKYLFNNEQVLEGAKIVAARAGDYRISYVVTDAGNNMLIKYIDFEVEENVALVETRFNNLPTALASGNVELGETVTLPTPEIIRAQTQNVEWYIKAVGPNCTINGTKFTPAEAGRYVLQYVGIIDGDTNNKIYSKEYEINVEDTTAPIMHLASTIPTQVDVNTVFTFPMVSATDVSGINLDDSYVSITSNNTSTTKITLRNLFKESTTKTKTLTKQEEYTVTYYMVDLAGNGKTTTYKIGVGDTINPTITLADNIVASTVKKGDKVTIKTSDITVADNVSTLAASDVEITLKNTTLSTTIDSLDNQGEGKYVYDITEAGTYTLTFKVTDEAGHTTTQTKTFTVDAEENNGVEKTEILGTILIVVAVLVLAGVIVYFIVSKKKNDRLYKK